MIASDVDITPLTEAELSDMARLGISRRLHASFLVGPFRYDNLKDAVQRAERELKKP